ncbi:MAG: hypothetical protein AAGA43_01355 [Bacteroidota bacterium]
MKNLEKPLSTGILSITPDHVSLTFVIAEKEKAICLRYEYAGLWFAERVGQVE